MTDPAAPQNSRRWWATIIGIAAAISLASGAGGAALYRELAAQPGACDARQVAAKALPSVVTILASAPSGSGTGSGAIIQADGVVLTNDHVIADAVTANGRITVLLDSGEQLPAVVVGTDPLTDLAVLKVDRTQLPAMPIAWNEHVDVGQPVVALGAPLGLSGTVTSGIVSALNRNVPAPMAGGGTTVLLDSIQTDAAINPGNSGGPLVTCEGRLVGVNTAISTVPNAEGVSGGGSVGIGFAVPATIARRVSQDLLNSGKASHPWLGLTAADISQETAARYRTNSGLYVQAVAAAGPAANAGILPGDIITELGGKPANSATLSLLLLTGRVGDSVPVEALRSGTTHQFTVTLTEQPSR